MPGYSADTRVRRGAAARAASRSTAGGSMRSAQSLLMCWRNASDSGVVDRFSLSAMPLVFQVVTAVTMRITTDQD